MSLHQNGYNSKADSSKCGWKQGEMGLMHVYRDIKWSSHLGKQFGRVFNSFKFVIQARVSAPRYMCEIAQSCLTPCSPMDCSLPRLFHPHDFPGKSTGVGCHFLLQGLGIHSSEIKTCPHRDLYMMFIAALFIIANT